MNKKNRSVGAIFHWFEPMGFVNTITHWGTWR